MAKKQEKEKPVADNETGKIKVKKLKKFNKEEINDENIKVDLKALAKKGEEISKVKTEEKPKEEKVEETKIEEVVDKKPEPPVEETKVEVKEEPKEQPVLEEIKIDESKKVEEVTEVASEAIKESMSSGKSLPEGVQKLMNFMEETGGDINDYVKLNRDYKEMDNHTLLKEYYKESKPHLSNDEVDFLMEDKFSYDEEADEERDIKRKKLALKEQVADARQHLDGLKSKYYEDIKAGSKLTSEQQKAIDFFNRYNKEEKANEALKQEAVDTFQNKTNSVFNKEFKGFEFNVGEKKYRFNVKDAEGVKETQSDINNFVKKFLNKNNQMEDAQGYHKSLYTAMNADAIAKHFYEQGKSDAMKDSIENSKNINMNPRQQHSGEINAGGLKVKVLGDDSTSLKFKIKNKK